MQLEDRLLKAMSELEEQKVLELVRRMLAAGVEPLLIIDVCRRGMEVVGRKYESREYYLSALIMSGEIFKEVMALLEEEGSFVPGRSAEEVKVVMGAPLGDVHDIGKDIVSMLLLCSGFGVVDLGVSVTPRRFVEAAGESGAAVVGMSVLLTVAYESIRETVSEFERAGLRERVKIIVGGGAASERLCEYAGADAWSNDAMDAVRFVKGYSGKE
jgi:methylmalonyl-CoA mutase cobalamin-binding domain/chain